MRRAEGRHGAALASLARHDAAADPQAGAGKHLAAELPGCEAERSRPGAAESAIRRAE